MSVKKVLIYARCSTTRDQKPEVQIEQLKKFVTARGWNIVEEIIDAGYSGTTDNRPGLKKLMKMVRSREVDVVAVVKLDRLFRSLKSMVNTISEFSDLGVEFVSTKDQIDLTTSAGKLLLHLLSSFAEFEADLIRERTLLGLDHAVSQGKTLGRPPVENKMNVRIRELRDDGYTYWQIQEELGVSKGVVYRAIKLAPKSVGKTDLLEHRKTGSYKD